MQMEEIIIKITTKRPASEMSETEVQQLADELEIAQLEKTVYQAVYIALTDYQLDSQLDFVVNS